VVVAQVGPPSGEPEGCWKRRAEDVVKEKKLSMGHKEGTEKKVPGHSICFFFWLGGRVQCQPSNLIFFTIRQLRKKFLLVAFFFFGYVRWIKNLFLVL
jgi:hypothetical protein